MKDEMPLRCEAIDGAIEMGIGVNVLAFAAEQHPEFEEGIKIINISDFAKEVVLAINDESEDGSNLLTRMLDEAIKKAVEGGCDGVDHGA